MIRKFCIVVAVFFTLLFAKPAFAGSWWSEEQQLLSTELYEEVLIELPLEKKSLADFVQEYHITPCTFHLAYPLFVMEMSKNMDPEDTRILTGILWDISHNMSQAIICGRYARS